MNPRKRKERTTCGNSETQFHEPSQKKKKTMSNEEKLDSIFE